MTTTIKQHMRFARDGKGQITDIMFDYRKKEVQEFFEDLMDTITIIERQNEPTIPFEDLKQEILAQRKKSKK